MFKFLNKKECPQRSPKTWTKKSVPNVQIEKTEKEVKVLDLTNDIIVHKKIDGTEFLQFRKLLKFPNVKHCYTLRKNHINVQIKGQDKTDLIDSYKKIAKALEIDYHNIIKPHQTHTDRVEIVNRPEEVWDEVDGMITNQRNIFLCTTSADCTSLFFYDDKKKVVGDVHSGWKGTLQQIGKKAVEKMKKEFDCHPEDIICCIGPCIQKCHFEVEEDVMKLFEKEFTYTGRIQEIIERGRKVEEKQKYNIDTTLINKLILQEAGLVPENIMDSGICTVCHSDLFHSYRVDKEQSGRNGAFIGMIL